MTMTTKQQDLLRKIPGVDHLLELIHVRLLCQDAPKSVVRNAIRTILDDLRQRILKGEHPKAEKDLGSENLLDAIVQEVRSAMALNLIRVINATGIVVHTNLGRSALACQALSNLQSIAGCYSNLEYDLKAGQRGSRYSAVEEILCELTGAEAGLVVNNNAGAVLLCLDTLARGRKVIVSRGELVEIGGSFRVPDVMAKSGAILKEVGTTNRTHRRDYLNAIDQDTALLLKVHTSNYSIVGFTAEVALKELVELGREHRVAVMEDLGSGTFIDFSRYGLQKEPTVQESVAAGTDVVTFSGDKLLGGPQAGLIVGKQESIGRVRQNPLTRALRIDKMTLAALESTLHLYRNIEHACSDIPTLRMLTMPLEDVSDQAQALYRRLRTLEEARLQLAVIDQTSKAGGGALPLLELPTRCVAVRINGLTVNAIERYMRLHTPPIIGRIEDDYFLMDPRTLQDGEQEIIQNAFAQLLDKG